MKSPGRQVRIKGKVFTGFVLLLLLAISAVIILIQIASQLSPPDTGGSQSVTKLSIVSNMLSTLIDADGQARAYITTGQRKFMIRYKEVENDVRVLADSLKNLSIENPEQYNRMITVDSLLDLKKAALENYFRLKPPGTPSIMRPERLQELVDRFSDTIGISYKTIPDHPEAEDDEAKETPEQKKENFLKKLWSSISGKQQKSDSVVQPLVIKSSGDTLHSYTKINDSAILLIRKQLQLMSDEERVERQLAIEREMMLLRADQDILDEIRNVLLLFEKEEINRTIAGAEHSREILRKLWNTALIAALTGLATMLIFLFLIWKDIARSNFYRKKLEEARKLAEKLLKVKEMFLANMSHEIRTPITSIIGFSEQMSGTRLNKDQSKYLKFINTSSEHLLRLVDDLLDFSRIESGKLNLEERHFSPFALIAESFETITGPARQKGLQTVLNQNIDLELKVTGDDLRIRQIIFNLLNNSIKFTSTGSITLDSSAVKDDEVVMLSICISDTGVGIPEEKQNEIFSEFTQADTGITRKFGGSGLGLAISRKLTEMMNGEIKLESKAGVGTSITVKIPLPIYSAVLPESTNEKMNILPDLSGFRILLAEDDETTRILLTENLMSTGAIIHETANGLLAWHAFLEREGDFDLVITDIQMPDLSGPELTKRIIEWTKNNQAEPCPILGLTAHSTPEDLKFYRELGMSDILLKPFRQAALYSLLRNLLNVKSVATLQDDKKVGHQLPDLSIFRQYANDDPDALQRILSSLSKGLDETIKELKQASEEGNFLKISRVAHRMLPNVRNLGDKETAALLLQLENLRNEEKPDLLKTRGIIFEAIENLTKLREKLRQ
ncbi:MAG: response regulator [Lentimicrobium sp.]|nr:response regulator [Lentimicrobium sp.]